MYLLTLENYNNNEQQLTDMIIDVNMTDLNYRPLSV